MAGFLYFLPSLRGITATTAATILRERGLADAIDAPGPTRQSTHPDAGDGLVLAAEGHPDDLVGIWPDRQTWRRLPRPGAPDAPPVWIGYTNDARPGPDDLARPEQLDGHLVTLADGRPWLVPKARRWVGIDGGGSIQYATAVPRVSELDDAGAWQPGRIVDRFAPFWQIAADWLEHVGVAAAAAEEEAGEGETARLAFDFDGLHEAAVSALAINYRIGPLEVSMLGLLTTATPAAVLDAAADVPGYLQLLKKTAAAGGPSNNGPEG